MVVHFKSFMPKYSSVEHFISSLPEPRKSEVVLLRELIFSVNPSLNEHIKWNAPSYYVEKKDDCITFNLHSATQTRLILHAGVAKKEDKSASPSIDIGSNLIVWNSNIRATMSFGSIDEIERRKVEIVGILSKWVDVFG